VCKPRAAHRPPVATTAPPAGGRAARAVGRLALGGAVLAAVLAAAPLGGAALAAQGVRLELRPRAGDTLRLRLDQEMETVATRRVRGADSVVAMQQRRVTVFSRSIAQRADANGTMVLAVTDSMFVTQADGRVVRTGFADAGTALHVGPDGATRVLDGGALLTPESAALLAQMPAMLPARPVPLGATWTHAAAAPIPGAPAGAPAGRLVATFRLDSLGRYGDVAHVSMRGTLEPPPGGVTRNGLRHESSGTVVGAFQVDRRRGWLTAVRATITTTSTVTAGGGEPVRIRTRVTQTLRVLGAVDKD
jgi:hypothetical protein